jgi:hypothetical protein
LSLRLIEEQDDLLAVRDKVLPTYFMDRDTFKRNIDSILNASVFNIEILTQICFPMRYDSLFDPTADILLADLQKEPLYKRQVKIANQIVAYGPVALTSLHLFKDQDNPKMVFWLEALRISLLGTSTIYYVRKESGYSFSLSRNAINEYNYSGTVSRASGVYNNWIRESDHTKVEVKYFIDFVVKSLETGKLNTFFEVILGSMITASLKEKDNDLLAPLGKYIDESNMELTSWMLYHIGAERDSEFYPKVLLQSLKSSNEEFVGITLDWTPPLWDTTMKETIYHVVDSLFEYSDDHLKHKAAYILLTDFDEQKAFDYFLSKARTGDVNERIAATYNIENPCEWGNELTDDVYNVLIPNLQSSNKELQSASLQALLRYRGERVVQAIIPFMNHYYEYIQRDIKEMLSGYENRSYVLDQIKLQILMTDDEALKVTLNDFLMQLSN